MKPQVFFECEACGKRMVKWMGRCPACGEWNPVDDRQTTGPKSSLARPEPGSSRLSPIRSIDQLQTEEEPRTRTGIGELDRVLGGGLVNRSVILVGGDPGIGKSTLLMQALGRMVQNGAKALYVSGEESAEQLRIRADRLGIQGAAFLVCTETRLETVLSSLEETAPAVVVIDSVQSLSAAAVESAAGSTAQIRHVASRTIDVIKSGQSACFIIGHVTKDGSIAGPKLMEHMVDTVIYFEGQQSHPYRILRATKNRFGSVSEIGVFEMGDRGLCEVTNPSELFLAERPHLVPGSVVTALVEGSRPILAEIQALVTGPVPGQGRRTCLGTDPQRLALMIAVMEKKLGIHLADQDIFLNAVGGVRATEPSVDLAVAAALLSSFTERPIAEGTLVFGEVGLAGEVRRASKPGPRLGEAVRLGFRNLVLPAGNSEPGTPGNQARLMPVSNIKDLGQALFSE